MRRITTTRSIVLLAACLTAAIFVSAAGAAGTVDQSQTTFQSYTTIGAPWIDAQTFTAGMTGELDQVDLVLVRLGHPGNLTVSINPVAASGAPASPALTATAVPETAVPDGGLAWVSVPFPTPAESVAGTQYAIVLNAPGSDAGSNYWAWGLANSDSYASGQQWTSLDFGNSWLQPYGSAFDFDFVTYVTAVDAAPPVLTLPADMTVTAWTPSGADVSYDASAWDAGDRASVPVTCEPASGSRFQVGVTNVRCTATDSTGNLATGSFTVTVVPADSTPPVLQGMPSSPLILEPESPQGTYHGVYVYATDDYDGVDPVVCSPPLPANGLWPIGTTDVTCSATDSWGNSTTGSFTVTVLQPRLVTLIVTNATVEPKTGAATIRGTIQVSREGADVAGSVNLSGVVTERIGRALVTSGFGSSDDPIDYRGGGPMSWSYTTTAGNGLLVAGNAQIDIQTYGVGIFPTTYSTTVKLTAAAKK